MLINPKNRKSEVLHFFLNNKSKFYSYLEISSALYQNNSHRYIEKLEKDGVKFVEKTIKRKNRFGRLISYKVYKLVRVVSANRIYNVINK